MAEHIEFFVLRFSFHPESKLGHAARRRRTRHPAHRPNAAPPTPADPIGSAPAPATPTSPGDPTAGPTPGSAGQGMIAAGVSPTPEHDLVFNGGKTIAALSFRNLYVATTADWPAGDQPQIDAALTASMTDPRLNAVLAQYFPNQAVSARFLGSQFLNGAKPATVGQGDVEALVTAQIQGGALAGDDFASTVYCVMLPPGVILTDDPAGAGGGVQAGERTRPAIVQNVQATHPVLLTGLEDAASSTQGLGGYHGSIHTTAADGSTTSVYYAVGVYSQMLPDGSRNGIPVFAESWKNVAATFYHELQEVRTDADVEDAIRTNNRAATGWISAQGEEIGDFPVFEAQPLTEVFKEVPLADGSATVPVQLIYSNRVHGPEDPTAPALV